MELVIKIAAVGIIVAVLQQILSRSGRDEYAMLVVLAGLIAVVAMLIPELKDLYSSAVSVLGL
ncbi:MAG TPA: stage III sporulation protein AC [Ruminococcaceae bacterium]|nr:stage III sporulation protein AC [Oscillospiraceae bacterium]